MKNAALALALFLAACGGTDDPAPAAPAEPAAAQDEPAAEPAAEPEAAATGEIADGSEAAADAAAGDVAGEAADAEPEGAADAEAVEGDAVAAADPAAEAAQPEEDTAPPAPGSGKALAANRKSSAVVASIKPKAGGPPLSDLAKRVTLPMETSKSVVEWVALKNGATEVKGRFNAIAGSVSLDPKDLRTLSGEVGIDLLGVSTGDEARDKNISTIFFGSTKAKPIHGQLTMTGLQPEKLSLAVGETTRALGVTGFQFGGTSVGAVVPLEIERIGESWWRFTLLEPLNVGIDELGMEGAKAALIKACEHESISNLVSATGTVYFGQPS